jgi:hypothetical protein
MWLGKLLLKISDLIGSKAVKSSCLKTDVTKSERLACLAVSEDEMMRKRDFHAANLDSDDDGVCRCSANVTTMDGCRAHAVLPNGSATAKPFAAL